MSKKRILLIVTLLIIATAATYYFYNKDQLASKEEEAPSMQVLQVVKQDLTEVLSTTGVVQSSEVKTVPTKIAGRVTKLEVEIGDEVKEGDILASIDDVDIKISIQDLENKRNSALNKLSSLKSEGNISLLNNMNSAQTTYENAVETYENNKVLYEVGSISKHELDKSAEAKNKANDDFDLAKTKHEAFNIDQEIALLEDDITLIETNIRLLEQDLEDAIINSPISGVITDIKISEGDFVQQNSKTFEIKDLQTLEVEAFISEYDISKISLNQEVIVTALGNRDKDYVGVVTKIYPSAEIVGGEATVKVLIDIKDEDKDLLPNFNAALEIIINKVENAFVIPYEALVSIREGKHGIMIKDGEEMRMLPVETGVRGDMHIQVISDEINEGFEVYIKSTEDEQTVRVPGMMPGIAPSSGGGGGGGRGKTPSTSP